MFHVTVLNIFRPLLQDSGNTRLRSFASSDSTPLAIFLASLQQLRRLLFEATKHPSYKVQSALLNPCVMHISNFVLAHSDGHNWRSTFLLCMSYWIRTTPSFPVLKDIAQSYVTMALCNNILSAEEAWKLRETLATASRLQKTSEVSSSVIVDWDRAAADKDAYRACEVAKGLDELITLEEFTNVNGPEPEDLSEDLITSEK